MRPRTHEGRPAILSERHGLPFWPNRRAGTTPKCHDATI
jgi:hypothetical protein